ncbi:Gfo/Idh/MocA family oxidoreductase [Dehalococcoidia bacterium]|nr:Gfo/Idh/MocA family oxidoreductase [Dehalococcoidia bacterium]
MADEISDSLLRVAVVGCGPRGRSHLLALSQFKNVILCAVCDTSEELANLAATEYGVAQRYTSLGDMITVENLDAVFVAVPAHLNSDVAQLCLGRGINTFLEKPPGLSADQTIQLNKIAAEAGAKGMVGWNRRFNNIVVKARELVEERGPVIQLVGEFHKSMEDYIASKMFPDYLLDNLILESPIHSVDLIRSFAGSEVGEVHAAVRRVESAYKDVHAALVVFDSGCIAQLTFNMTTATRLERYEIHGRGISAYLEGIDRGEVVTDEGTVDLSLESNGIVEQARYFLDCVANDQPISLPASNLDEAVKTMKLAESILAGLRE